MRDGQEIQYKSQFDVEKHVNKFGIEWDHYFTELCAYLNVAHVSTG